MFGTYGHFGYTTLDYNFRFRPHTIAIKIGPGEIVYVGNFVVAAWAKSKGLFKGRELHRDFHYIGADLPAAQEKLKAYQNVTGTVIYRKPESIELKLPVEQ